MKALNPILVAALLITSGAAIADFRTIARANEVILSELQLPASANGAVGFKTCRACDRQLVSVSDATEYVLNGRRVSLTELRRSVATVSNREKRTAIVMHHLESDLVTRISISL